MADADEIPEVWAIDLDQVESVVLRRLIREVRQAQEAREVSRVYDRIHTRYNRDAGPYNRVHNRHNRGH